MECQGCHSRKGSRLILFRSSEAAKLRPVFVFLIPGAVDGGYGGEDNLQGLQLVAPQVGRIS